MKRNTHESLQTVTASSVPVLIPTDRKSAQGWCMTSEGALLGGAVREVTRNDVSKSKSRILGRVPPQHIAAINLFGIALHEGDRLAMEEALRKIFSDPAEAESLGGRKPDNWVRHLMDLPSERLANVLACGFMGRIFDRTRLLFWVRANDQQIGPAVYCPDFETAVDVHLILRGALRMCAHCQELFWSQKAGKMSCSPKCRDTHRVARWRAKNKK